MHKHISLFLLAMMFVTALFMPFNIVHAEMTAKEDIKNAQAIVKQAITKAEEGNLLEANEIFLSFKKTWRVIEEGVKNESGNAYKDIESEMGKVIYAFSREKQDEVINALNGLKAVNEKFINGEYPTEKGLKQQNISLSEFITYLLEVKEQTIAGKENEAKASMSKVTDSWLSVEGIVVAQSAKVYSDTEKDMVIVQAMLTSNPPNYDEAITLIDQMVEYLTPLAAKNGYSLWDAAMIIIREGLEALLVIIALLAFVNKSNHGKGKSWIWSGVTSGIIISIILAVIVKLLFSSGAFGTNNALIAGWTGLIAAIMLLYVSYWLHSNSSTKQWQNYIQEKSQTALATGKLVSLGVISFLAVFREGTETVLFFLGMVNQISIRDLILGLLIGVGLLLIIAYLMVFVGVRLPIRPFFILSSIIVFYLTVKFLGMGIHSLQLAGVMPTTTISIPSIDLFALYPTLESTLPQIILITVAIIVVAWKRVKQRLV